MRATIRCRHPHEMKNHAHTGTDVATRKRPLAIVVLVMLGLLVGAVLGVADAPTAEAADPPITLSPSPLDFGTHPVGTQGKVRSVTLTNQSGGALWLEEWRVDGALWDGGIFGAAHPEDQPGCPVLNQGHSIAAGASCTLSVAFSPTSTTDYRAALKVRVKPVGGDVLSATTHEVPITATGIAAQLSFTPANFSFGDVPMGTGASTTVTVKNVTAGPVTITGVTSPDQNFYAERGTCGQPGTGFILAAGGSCAANVYFSPSVGGSEERRDYTGHVYVRVADPKSATGAGPTYIWRPAGVGVGTRALALEGPTTIDFGRVRIGARSPRLHEFGQSFTIRNTGSLSVDIDINIMDGPFDNSGGYGFPRNISASDPHGVPGRCWQNLTLNPGAGCWIEPYFDPDYPEPDAVGQTDRTIEIVSDAPGSPHRVSLKAFAFYDREPPTTVPVVLEPATSSNGWYRSDVSVDLSATDAPADGAGVASITYSTDAGSAQQIPETTVQRAWVTLPTISAEGTTTILYGATDRDGNREVSDKGLRKSFRVELDKTAPTTTATLSTPPTADGWHAGDVTVNLAADDALSGVHSVRYRALGAQPVDATTVSGPVASLRVSTAGETTLFFAATDQAGNVEAEGTITVKVDGAAPETTAAVSPEAGSSGWHTSDATVTLAATDIGTGVRSLTYSATGAQPIARATVNGTSARFTINAEGTTTVSYAATDLAGNVEATKTLLVKLDKSAPTFVCAEPDGRWHADDVSLACTAGDPGSGMSATDAAFSLSTDVAAGDESSDARTGSREIADIAGNTVTAGPISGNMVDKKAPNISLTAPSANGAYLVDEVVHAAYSCTDGGSLVATCAGAVPSGHAIDTATLGAQTFTVTARDNVGNQATATADYTVSYRICVLFDQAKSHKVGSTVPIKLRVCDASGANRSSTAITLTASGLTKLDSTVTSAPAEDSGSANPDRAFRYDATLEGYIYNLSTKGLTRGTWALSFAVNGDPAPHRVTFDVR